MSMCHCLTHSLSLSLSLSLHKRVQTRAPHSPVVIVGTHEDKINSRTRRELEQAKEYINKMYGTLEKRKEGFPQVNSLIEITIT